MQILAIIGIVVGLVVLLVVIRLLTNTLTPLREILADVQGAHSAPLLERGVPGTEQLGQTRRLAESVPQVALAYLSKLGANPAPRPAEPSYSAPAPAPAPAPAAQADAAPSQQSQQPEPPAWKKYITK